MRPATLERDGSHRSEVGPVELFFDLVYVFAIIQLSHLLIGNLSPAGAAQTVVIFAAVWWGWNYTAWAMNWLNPRSPAVQLLNAVLMLTALGMSVTIPDAFGRGAWLFVGCYLAMGILRPVFMMVAFRGRQLASNYRMLLGWTLLAGVFWVAGAAFPEKWRLIFWLVAVLVDYSAPLLHYRLPGIGAAPMHLWDTDAEHLAERNRLVFIIALGESILLMGGVLVDEGGVSLALAVSLVVGFASLFVLWWNYFAAAGPAAVGGRETTGALRSAYAYAHALMVLGAILVAVSTELRLSHDHLDTSIVMVTIGGPVVYLVGNLLFLLSRFGRLPVSRVIAIAVLAVMAVVTLLYVEDVPIVVLSLCVFAVTGSLAGHTVLNSRKSGPSV
ncbi:low temperature requirement protein A [Corynebacterium sp.]|uniref:low temperature requirement protein A n=1 Tax=Corynebacterium sp. TaxID=1720 RepID=UPI003B3A0EB0